ncbi:MAG: hypothetical protein K9L82_11155 [Chromatiaceae bacterium]|nr:hypothetical protein [Chromatiaceae bacterium]MCF8004796.1 hypothetical protein [Chromatiaceae bacterium]
MTAEYDSSSDLSDLLPLRKLAKELEAKGIATPHQMNWWLRFRDVNGLLDCGAVSEVRGSPHTKRPTLYARRSRFIAWLSGDAARAA